MLNVYEVRYNIIQWVSTPNHATLPLWFSVFTSTWMPENSDLLENSKWNLSSSTTKQIHRQFHTLHWLPTTLPHHCTTTPTKTIIYRFIMLDTLRNHLVCRHPKRCCDTRMLTVKRSHVSTTTRQGTLDCVMAPNLNTSRWSGIRLIDGTTCIKSK